MLHCTKLERVVVAVIDAQAHFSYADGSGTHVALDVISRSSLLRQAILDTDQNTEEANLTICVPEDFLSIWIDAVHRSRECHPSLREEAVLEMCLAADFFDDPALLRSLSKEAAAWVCECPNTSAEDPEGSESFHTDRLVALGELPMPVVAAVVDACSKADHEELLNHLECEHISNLPESSALALRALQTACQEASKLKEDTRSVPVDADACTALWKSLPKAASLESLWIQRGSLYKDSIQQLAVQLPTLTYIRDLKLESLGISPETAPALAPSLSNSCLPHLTRLSLTDNPLGCAGITTISQHLATHSSLVDLRLTNIQMCSQGAAAFAPCLGALTKIRYFDISCNPLGTHGINALEYELGQLSTLRRLYVRNCGLDALGANMLVHSIVDLTKLIRLDLTQNQVTSTGCDMYAAAVSVLTSVRDLSMQCKEMTVESATSFGHAFEELTVVEKLVIQDGQMTAEVIRVLAEYLAVLPFLMWLDLGITCFDESEAVYVATCLSRLRSLRRLSLCTSEGCRQVLWNMLPSECEVLVHSG